MIRILCLTASFGEGHNSAARNIRDALLWLGPPDIRVEIYDPLREIPGWTRWLEQGYPLVANEFPWLWRLLYRSSARWRWYRPLLARSSALLAFLDGLLHESEPDAVVCTYPLFNFYLHRLYREGRAKPFHHWTIVTDTLPLHPIWYEWPTDAFAVPDEATGAFLLQKTGMDPTKIHVTGFPVPVSLAHLSERKSKVPQPIEWGNPRILYVLGTGWKWARRIVELLAQKKEWTVTVVCGRNVACYQRLKTFAQRWGDRVEVLGWTGKMAELLLSHHVVVGKAGGALVQEVLAAHRPMVITQVFPGQEEGNEALLRRLGVGFRAQRPGEVVRCLEELFAHNGRRWKELQRNWPDPSRADAAVRIARAIVSQCEDRSLDSDVTFSFSFIPRMTGTERSSSVLLCDFHAHTTFSDGSLTLRELVDFYGSRGFDCLCVTDHLVDPKVLLGRLCRLTGLVLVPSQLPQYFAAIEEEKRRAWTEYGLILFAGIEFNKDSLAAKSSAHLLGVDVKTPIDPGLSLEEIIDAIHDQGGLAIASHPHKFQSVWGKDTLYLWENRERFALLLDAWEIANRHDLFTPVSLKKLPFVANSDFHKPKHIYSWKTVLFCEKDPEAIKACIRANEKIAISLYRGAHWLGKAGSGWSLVGSEQKGKGAFSPRAESRAKFWEVDRRSFSAAPGSVGSCE
ncbi:MGDG synthase family glycosyltransferase [Candidatus Methylacidithermus pantelleriae]|uniref:UDP-N-acetylglucosamine:LPS N-acetylglucosamine transferase fused to PHP family phosphoesterase n=1 Tax=Candidatus Methylacidithermus pantelleriae TaxID=2744239 RepID=A0A8J2FS08_9BACT|nr:UDP-N-acetylglucosamine--LPS N-acetylglucosamine transferase [Candidatus Methylacidithermus pantelleriae]CAF0692502.1 UDP-N-acetylglucosamine:LPS N-acetylglucosamine transferase fused to PHP family phosphoesterase [Candidatus Methylacidithermus pantelleriae]